MLFVDLVRLVCSPYGDLERTAIMMIIIIFIIKCQLY